MSGAKQPLPKSTQHEAAIQALAGNTGVDPAQIQALYEQEFAVLERTATVRSFLSVIASRNVREALRHR